MQKISSRENPFVRKVLKIKSNPQKFAPSEKIPLGEVLIEGPEIISTALHAGIRIKGVLITEEFLKDKAYTTLLNSLLEKSIPVRVIDYRLLKRLSETITPQGILAIGETRIKNLEEIKDRRIITLDCIQDPGNMGTIIRTVDAAGFKTVVAIKGSVNPFSPKAIRASAGSVFNTDIVIAEREDFINWCKEKGIPLIVTAQRMGKSIFKWLPPEEFVLVFGNEAKGVSEDFFSLSSEQIQIPILGKAESLNVAVSAAILLYKIVELSSLD